MSYAREQRAAPAATWPLYLDSSDGEGDLPPSIDVCVQNTKNVLELLRNNQSLDKQHSECHSMTHDCHNNAGASVYIETASRRERATWNALPTR